MARPPQDVPKMCRHKASGQAVVRLGGKDHYLGPWGTAKAKAAYHRLAAEWIAQGDRIAGGPPLETVAELAAAYLAHAHRYYRKDGRPTSELSVLEAVWRYALALYADARLEDFGPLALKAVRSAMIRAGLARRTINTQIQRLRRAWRWAAENELLDAELWHRLAAVPGLRPGRGGRETEPRQPVAREEVEAVRPHVARQVWAMIELQWLTGMRSGEVVLLRPGAVDRRGDVWTYRPDTHKTAHIGRERLVALGPHAQAVLAPWLLRGPDEPCFQPLAAEAERRRELRAERIARGGVGNHKHPARRPRSRPGERYSVCSYRRAVVRGCKKAGTPSWTPHQLRHAFATRVREAVGLDAAQAALGHSRASTTEIYAHLAASRSAEVARQLG